MLSVGLLFVFGAISCTQTDTEGAQADAPPKNFPRWVEQEKIRVINFGRYERQK
jgi:hypothetical protein